MRLYDHDLRIAANRISEALPLLPGTIEIQGFFVAGHPRIDDILDRKIVGRTHQNLVCPATHHASTPGQMDFRQHTANTAARGLLDRVDICRNDHPVFVQTG